MALPLAIVQIIILRGSRFDRLLRFCLEYITRGTCNKRFKKSVATLE